MNIQVFIEAREGRWANERDHFRNGVGVPQPKALWLQTSGQAIRAQHHLGHFGNDGRETKAANA
jgi:hypothetical protein